jgi:hypothetical protein
MGGILPIGVAPCQQKITRPSVLFRHLLAHHPTNRIDLIQFTSHSGMTRRI